MSQSQQPPAGGSVPRRVGFHSRLQRELDREGSGSEGSGPPPRSLLNARRTAEATAAARRAAAMQSEGDHDADLLNGQDPLAATPSRRPPSIIAATTTTATTSSLVRTRRHISSTQPPAPAAQPAPRQFQPPRDLLQLQEQEREQQDTTLFSSPPPAMSTLPIYRTPRADQQATTPTSRPMGFDSPALFASPASPSWSSVNHHGPLSTTSEIRRPTLLRSLFEIPDELVGSSVDGSDLEREVETAGEEEDEGLYAGHLSFGDPRELSFRMSRGVHASSLSPTSASSLSPTPVSSLPSPTQVASSLASPIASSVGTSQSPHGRRSQSPSRPYGEWRQHARRLELQYASRYGSPRREIGEPQGRLDYGLQRDEGISRRRHLAVQPYNARFLQGDEEGTISPPRRLDLAAMTLSPSTPAAATIVAGRVNTSSLAISSAAPVARATAAAATEAAVAAASSTTAVEDRTGTTTASVRTRMADDPDEFWSSSSSGQRSTRLLPNIPSSRPGLVPRFYRRGHGASSSSPSVPQQPEGNSNSRSRNALLPRSSLPAREDGAWQDAFDRRRPLASDNVLGQAQQTGRDLIPQYASRYEQERAAQHEVLRGLDPLERERQPSQIQQQLGQRQQDEDPRRQDREREPEEQYVHEIYEDPESDEAADGEEYDQNERSGQNNEPTEQDKTEVQEDDEDEDDEEENVGLARADPSADLLLDASRAYRARHLSNAGRRLSQEDAEDPFQSSGRRHKRARFNKSLESLEGEISVTGDESFGINVSAEMGVASGSHDSQTADRMYQERDLKVEDVDEADDTALLYDDLDERGQQQQLPDGHPPSSLYDVDVDTSLQVGLADSDAEADMATVDEADLYGLFESPPPELGTGYRRSVDDYEENDLYGQQPSHLHGHDEVEVFPEHAMMVPPPSVQQLGNDQDEPYMNGGLSSDSEPEEATVKSDDDTDKDEGDDEEEAERLQQLIEATVNQGPEAVAVLSGFRAPGSSFQGPVQREVISSADDLAFAPDTRDELREIQVLNEELWWDLEPRELDSREERVL